MRLLVVDRDCGFLAAGSCSHVLSVTKRLLDCIRWVVEAHCEAHILLARPTLLVVIVWAFSGGVLPRATPCLFIGTLHSLHLLEKVALVSLIGPLLVIK